MHIRTMLTSTSKIDAPDRKEELAKSARKPVGTTFSSLTSISPLSSAARFSIFSVATLTRPSCVNSSKSTARNRLRAKQPPRMMMPR